MNSCASPERNSVSAWIPFLDCFPASVIRHPRLSRLGVASSRALGLPKIILARMSLNILINEVVGIIPGVGDAFSFWFESNARNYRILQEHAAGPRKARRSDWIFVIAVLSLLLLIVCTGIASQLFCPARTLQIYLHAITWHSLNAARINPGESSVALRRSSARNLQTLCSPASSRAGVFKFAARQGGHTFCFPNAVAPIRTGAGIRS